MIAQSELTRLQGLADQHRVDARRALSLEELANDAYDEIAPTGIEILDLMVENFGMTHAQAIECLICVDFVALRKELVL